jgi:hypothetical protein
MSYIGKNPKVDSVKLEGSATAASGTEEGQLYYNTGTGSISKGLKVFKNSQFVSIDKQLGDADTFHLLKAADISTAEFSAARNSTSTSFLNQNAVPFETTTASGAAGTFSNSSTGDALLTDESADLVFAYKSSGTSDDAQEYFGIPLSVPKAFRGGNVVLSFEYRTGFGTGTTATVDGDFEVAVLDKSTGNGAQVTSTDSTTDITAGSNIAVSSKTGFAVGQRVRLEAGSQSTIGNPDATVVEAFVTSISTSTDHITISENWDTPHASGARITSGWLTDVVPGQLPAADSQTNKQGKKFSIQFKTEDDTSDIVLFFQNKNTSSTISRHLFVDNILLSANKFLQASSQLKSEQFLINTWDGRAGNSVYSDATPTKNTMDKLGTVTNSSTEGFFFTAKQRCKVSFDFMMQSGGTPDIGIAGGSSTLDFYNNNLQSTHFDGYRLSAQAAQTATGNEAVSAEIVLEKDEKIGVVWSDSTSTVLTGNNAGSAVIVATSEVSDTILLESQDEIFTDWIPYTPSFGGVTSTAANTKFAYRRVGSSMEIFGSFVSATVAASALYFTLPSGFQVDVSAFYPAGRTAVGVASREAAGIYSYEKGNTAVLFQEAGDVNLDRIYFHSLSTGAAFAAVNGNGFMGTSEAVSVRVWSIPISGFNSNFNPLLSLPLVDTGDSHEFFWGYDTSAASSKTYRAKLDNITTNTVSTLGTIDNNSANGWSFQANQRVKVYFNFGMACSTAIAGVAAVKYSASNLGTPATSTNANITNSYWDSYRVTSVQDTGGSGYQGATSGSFIMEAGEYLQFGSENTNFQNSNKSVVTMIVEKAEDRKQLAHIIKPAVAVISNTQSSATYQEGQFGGSNSYVDRVLNTMKGETWFVNSLSSNVFELQAGTYKVYASAPGYYINSNRIRLLNTTDSITQIQGQINYAASSYNGQSLAPLEGTFTITSAKSFKIQHINEFNYANNNALGNNSAAPSNGGESVFTRVTIEKLK